MSQRYNWERLSPLEQLQLQERENPRHEATGHYTGRCERCGSDDLWDDCTAYGCNRCGAIYFTG